MEGQLNLDCERFQQITKMAKMGWWESDVKNQQYICSDFIVDLLGLESHRISFKEFHHRIREDHRMRLRNEFISHSNLAICGQTCGKQMRKHRLLSCKQSALSAKQHLLFVARFSTIR